MHPNSSEEMSSNLNRKALCTLITHSVTSHQNSQQPLPRNTELPNNNIRRLKTYEKNMNSLDPKSSTRGSCNARVLIQPEQGTGSEIAQPNTENLINSVQTMRGSTQFPPDLRTRHPNPTESQPRTHGGPTHYTHTQDQANVERFRRRVGRPNRVPRHSSCERRGARPSLGQRGS
jgi:hypothetical protein